MDDLSGYTLDDFLSDSSFRRWVRTGGFRDASSDWARRLSAVQPDCQETARQAQRLLLAAFQEEEMPTEAETEAVVEATYQRIQAAETPVVPIWQRRSFRVAAALTALLLAGLGGWWRWNPTVPEMPGTEPVAVRISPEVGWLDRVNDSPNPLVVALEDGSSVVLRPGSRLHFPKKFHPSTREVTLEGEGFFEVSKNPDRPFFVYANGLTTRVVGTSFRVRAFAAEGRVTVLVKTGKVAVFGEVGSGKRSREILLLPNQRAVFDRAEARLLRTDPEPPTPQTLAVERASFEFSDAPVSEILRAIETAYGLRIEYDQAALAHCQLTTSLADEPLYQKLAILCEALGNGSYYEAQNGKIVLHSRGCE